MFFGALGQLSIGQYNAPGTPTSVVLDPHVQPIGVFALGQGSLQNDASGYTLAANYTNFVLSGIAAPLVTGLFVTNGAYGESGQVATLNPALLPASGPFNLTGQNVTFPIVTGAQGYGQFNLSGQVVVFNSAIVTANGGFTETGYTTVTAQSWSVSNGSVTEAGQVVIFVPKILAQYATFAETGQAATYALTQIEQTGNYNLSGKTVIFGDIEGELAGYFTLSGQNATFQVVEALAKGTYSETGQSITFVPKLVPAAGQFTLTGQAEFDAEYFYVLTGYFAVNGQAAPLIPIMNVGQGAYQLSGQYVRIFQNSENIIEEWTKPSEPTGTWTPISEVPDPWQITNNSNSDVWTREY